MKTWFSFKNSLTVTPRHPSVKAARIAGCFGSTESTAKADKYSGTDIKEISRRKKIFGGEKEELLQVMVNVGTFYSLTVPAERRSEVDALIAALEKARDSATS